MSSGILAEGPQELIHVEGRQQKAFWMRSLVLFLRPSAASLVEDQCAALFPHRLDLAFLLHVYLSFVVKPAYSVLSKSCTLYFYKNLEKDLR